MAQRGRFSDKRSRDPDDQAIDWVVRLTSGMATDQELEDFVRWRDASPENASALAEARRLWTSIGEALVAGQERQLADLVAEEPRPRSQPQSQPSHRRRLSALVPAAGRVPAWVRRARMPLSAVMVASLALALVLQWPLADVKSGDSIRRVTLADGSVATLAPGSAMDVNIGPSGERHVELKEGEALFDVRHDASRPFYVKAGEGAIRVLGTAFSVRMVSGMTQVVVTRGRVSVSSGAERRILVPNREVVYGLTTMGSTRAIDAASATSWTHNRLNFEQQTLGDVIAELDRFDSRRILLLDRNARARRINAVVDLNRTDDWLKALVHVEGLSMHALPGLVVIY